MGEDIWAGLVDQFADKAYASVNGLVRTYVMHQHLVEHLPPAPATVLDVGGGAGHQSFPLARAGYDVTLLDPCATAGGIVSIMTGNARTTAVLPALERRWDDALAAFDTSTGIGVLGVRGRADTVEEVSDLIRARGVEPLRWYGVWLFVDWLEFSGVELDQDDSEQVAATAAVELEASRRDPYRQLSRVFHLVGRKGPA